MKTFVIPSIKRAIAPTENENLSSGYPIGQHWFDTATGKEYYHSSDRVWKEVATTHKALTSKNEEADFQHVDTTTIKENLVPADMVAVKDSATGNMVLTPKSNLQTDLTNVNQAITTLQNGKANKTQEEWIEPTLNSPWVNSANKVMYMKDEFGFVHCKGYVSGGAVGSYVFILPAGYRPYFAKYFICNSDGYRSSYMYVNYEGKVILNAGTTAGLSLDGIVFKAGS